MLSSFIGILKYAVVAKVLEHWIAVFNSVSLSNYKSGQARLHNNGLINAKNTDDV